MLCRQSTPRVTGSAACQSALSFPPRLYSSPSSPERVGCVTVAPFSSPHLASHVICRDQNTVSVCRCLFEEKSGLRNAGGGGGKLQYLRERQYFIIPLCRMAVRSLLNLYRCCVERPFSRKLLLADHSRLLPSLDSPFLFLIKVMKTKGLMLKKCNFYEREQR